ncbi:MAG: thiamine pyrophosphate-binding protein [Candidatus Tectomicrobia bacterium]|uniref:Thiamine pyrophosphate-binding protein n=1 Tax=Tectimicrobiota bacterium TaxID=2528274 RepID=A0A933GKR7_UNCTE|nr:thiamine pyrophosphate-binding protein [Candidatus Tectomicrobia bacterium]
MSSIDGGHLVAKALKIEGIERIFTLSGQSILPIYNGCLDNGIRIIDTRHEQAAGHMADICGRITGKPGVCLFTQGPGHTNSITALTTAFLAQSPLLSISGNSSSQQFDTGVIQEIDQVGLVRPITKWSRLVTNPARIPEYIATAFRHSLAGKPGPVHLSIPIDVLNSQVDEEKVFFEEPQKYHVETRMAGDGEKIAAAMDLLKNAHRPVIIAGNGVWWSRAGEELREFIEFTNIPLFTTNQAQGVVADTHHLCFGGPVGILIRAARQKSVFDVALILGESLKSSLNLGRPPLFPREAKIILADTVPQEIGLNRGVDVGILGDSRSVLQQLIKEAGRRGPWKKLPWLNTLEDIRRERDQSWAKLEGDTQLPLHPAAFCKEIRELVDEKTTLVLDAGDLVSWALRGLKALFPNQILMCGPLGQLGVGIPFANGAKLLRPDHKVVLICGDGSFGFSAMEFDTAVRHKLPIVCVIGNDSTWGMIKRAQKDNYGPERIVATELRPARYEKVAEALGGYGEYVEKAEDIKPAILRALASGLPSCLNVAMRWMDKV